MDENYIINRELAKRAASRVALLCTDTDAGDEEREEGDEGHGAAAGGGGAMPERGPVKLVGKWYSAAAVALGPRTAERASEVLAGLRTVKHVNVGEVKDVVVDGPDLCVVSPLATAGTLEQARVAAGGLLPAAEVSHVGHLVAEALAHAHANNVLHTSLHLDNVLLMLRPWDRRDEEEEGARGEPVTQFRVVVTDFCAASLHALAHPAGVLLGQPSFLPPEQLADPDEPFTPAGDVWSFGAVLLTLATGFKLAETREHRQALRTKKWTVEATLDALPKASKAGWAKLPAPLQALVKACLQVDPARRPTASQVQEHEAFSRRRMEREVELRYERDLTVISVQLDEKKGLLEAAEEKAANVGRQLETRTAELVAARERLEAADKLLARYRKSFKDTVSSMAGTGSGGNGGDGAAAAGSVLHSPTHLAWTPAGDLIFTDQSSQRVRKISAGTGILTTIAGRSGSSGYGGDGGDATGATLNFPFGIAVDAAGNIYVADQNNHRVRKIATNGTIFTFAGNGSGGYSGDGGAATSAQLYHPRGLCFDRAGNLYIADGNNHRVRKVATNGTISTFAGNGSGSSGGDGGAATSAQVNYPLAVAADADGNIFIAECSGHRVRKVEAASGRISTVCGTGVAGFSDDRSATSGQLNGPYSVALTPDSRLLIADCSNHRIRVVDLVRNHISTLVGTGTAGYNGDGPARSMQLHSPYGVACSPDGILAIAEAGTHRIRRVLIE